MYNLYSLGWHNFQQLCLTICREILGQTVQSFLDSNDGGRDGAFAGIWTKRGEENIEGQFVIQCKFTNRKAYNLRSSDLSEELKKVKRLVSQGRCDAYVLITNAGLSGKTEKSISMAIKAAGVKHVLLLGSTWIFEQVRENKRLRMLVPRVYGLGDLSQILDERAYSQAHALLESMRDDLSKIVITRAYRQAASALEKHGFVLLIGEPAAGKTTIASLLAMAAIDQWQASPLKVDEPGKVIEHWNPEEPSQFFWVDDAFGVTQYEADLVRDWNHSFAQIKAMLKKGAKVVMTSRDYIYNRARNELKTTTFPLLQESQVVIDVRDLSIEEKQQILYNHMKMGAQPRSFKTKIKPFLANISTHARFIPETARRLADPIFTKGLNITGDALVQYVDQQQVFLQDLIRGLDCHSKAGLALVYMRNDHLQSPVCLEEVEKVAIDRLGSTLGGCVIALETLQGSLVRLYNENEELFWRFKHPTIGDAFGALLALSPELLEIFVLGSSTEKLIEQVTCGDVKYENAIILGKRFFPLIIQRLDNFRTASYYKSKWQAHWEAKSRIHYFLARRCSKEFLELYIRTHPELLDQVAEPGLYLSAVSELNLALKLYQAGLLPEEKRLKLVGTVTTYAVKGEDLYALENPNLKTVFTDAEFRLLRNRVLSELVPRLDDVRREQQYSYSDATPEEQIEPFLDLLRILEAEFDDPEVHAIVNREKDRIEEWLEERTEDKVMRRPRNSINDLNVSNEINNTRDIFDDVDV